MSAPVARPATRSNPQELGGGFLITRLVSSSIVVPDGQTLIHRNPVLGPGVTITLAGTGELFVL